MTTKTQTVFVQNWEESERGWGTRPDGFTVHVDGAQLAAYVRWHNQTYNNLPEAPDEYTRTSGEPIEVEVDSELFDRIKSATLVKRKDGTPKNSVHGVERLFSTSPMRALKSSDINWPTKGEKSE